MGAASPKPVSPPCSMVTWTTSAVSSEPRAMVNRSASASVTIRAVTCTREPYWGSRGRKSAATLEVVGGVYPGGEHEPHVEALGRRRRSYDPRRAADRGHRVAGAYRVERVQPEARQLHQREHAAAEPLQRDQPGDLRLL